MKKVLFLLLMLLVFSGCSQKKEIENNKVEKIDELAYNWNYYSGINDDYMGTVRFKSGLVDLPFFKGETNDTYLRTNWQNMEYDIYGSIFMDSDCDYDSQNIIIYGHYVDQAYDPNGENIMFTPLKKLMDKENYEDNKYIELVLKDEIRTYEIVAVYYCPLAEEDGVWYVDAGLIYNEPEYTLKDFEEYKTAIQKAMFYPIEADFNYEDKLLTLQTCVEGREDLREIVVAKQIEQ